MLVILGYIGAVSIGFILGLIGGGGSILTIPVLVYLMGVNTELATAYSLFVVGSTALIGAAGNMARQQVSYQTAVIFAIPSFLAVYLTRRYLLPAIPDSLFDTGFFELTKDKGMMLLFATLMLMTSYSMIKGRKEPKNLNKEKKSPIVLYSLIALEGVVIGALTGLVGAGGGFLIIPALVLLVRLPMKIAVGTSLLIISVKSLVGFVGDLGAEQPIDWTFLLTFSALSILGIYPGMMASKRITGPNLRKTFGWFVLAMAVFIVGKEILFSS